MVHRCKNIIIFAKNPEAGKVKTRLAKTIGPEQACGLYKAMLQKTIEEVKKSEFPAVIALDRGDSHTAVHSIAGNSFRYTIQKEGHLGLRMKEAFIELFKNGAGASVLIGTDIPELTASCLKNALKVLDNHAAVIGPSIDGGYYLIGWQAEYFNPKIFENITWSTPQVFRETLQKLKESGTDHYILNKLNDLDNYNDMIRYYEAYHQNKQCPVIRYINRFKGELLSHP